MHNAAYLLAAFSLSAAALGLIRDRVLAHLFGAGGLLDVYYASFKVPDLIFIAVASLFSLYAVIPFLNNTDDVKARQFIGGIIAFFLLASGAIASIACITAPLLLPLLFPELAKGEYATELVVLTRLLLLQPILLGLSGIVAAVTQTYGRFALYAIGPLLYNAGIIVGAYALYPSIGVLGLGYGVLIGAVMHLAIQIPFAVENGFLALRSLKPALFEALLVMRLSLPRTLAITSHHVALFILLILAARLSEGSVAVFTFAMNLQAVPLAMIGASYSVAAFPTLARLFASGEQKQFLDNFSAAMRHIIFWSAPITVFVIVLRAQIVRVVLGSGAFDWTDTRLTAAALALFIIGLTAESLVLLFSRGYYAAGKTRIPFIIGTLSAVLTVVLAILFLGYMQESTLFGEWLARALRVTDIEGVSVIVLPLAHSIGIIAQFLLLFFLFRKTVGKISIRLGRMLADIGMASVVSGGVTYGLLQYLNTIFDINTFSGIFSQGVLAGLSGVLAYIAVLLLLNNREITEAYRALRSKFWKVEAVASDQSEL